MYKLLYTEEAKKQIAKCNEKLKGKIRLAIDEIVKDPSTGKLLTRELKGRYSYRIEDYRIIYRIYRTEILVLILAFGHRKDVYIKLSRKGW